MTAQELVLSKARQDINWRWWSLAGLLGIMVAFNPPAPSLQYGPLVIVFGLSITYNFLLAVMIHHKIFNRFLSFIEIIMDICLITVLVQYTGGLFKSVFFLMYPLIIAVRIFKIQRPQLAFATAGTLAALLVLALTAHQQVNWYHLLDKILLLAGLGVIGNVLAGRYQRSLKRLEETNMEKNATANTLLRENEKLKQNIAFSTERLQDVTITVMKKNMALMAFQEIYSAMSTTNNPRRLLNLVIDTAMSLLQGTVGCLMLTDELTGKLRIRVARGMSPKMIRSIHPKLNDGIEGEVLESGKKIFFGDLSVTGYKPLLTPAGRSKLCVPIVLKDKPIGVLSVEKDVPEAYTHTDLELMSILSAQTAEVLQNIEIYQEMQHKAEGLELLFDVNKNIGTIYSLRKLFEAVLERAMQVMKAKGGSLLIYERLNDELMVRASLGLNNKATAPITVSTATGIAGWVFQNVKPLLIHSVETSSYYDRENDELYAGKDLIACPLNIRKKVFGVICLNDRQGGKHFTKDDLALLGALASQAAIAIENVELYASIRRDYINAVKALAAAVDAKDHYTHGHSNKVMAYSAIIARELGMSDKEVEKISYGALLHDVGKIGISESLLNKPSRLTPKEFDTIAMHPILGVSIVQNIESLRDLIPTILYHHERYNGGGYPEGKAGNSIPLGARIVAVADAWDVMTSDRAYRKALPINVAVAELKKCSNTQFDPELVELFLAALKKNEKIEPFKEEETANLVWDEEGIGWMMD